MAGTGGAAGMAGSGGGTASVLVLFPNGASAYQITAGPDGNMWFTENRKMIGRVTPLGELKEFTCDVCPATAIAGGPDGNVWFTSPAGVSRMTPAGVITTFAVTGEDTLPDITSGPDGNLWFCASTTNQIGRITPAGAITGFPIPTPAARPFAIAAATDGNIWFIGSGTPSAVERLSFPPSQPPKFDEFPAPDNSSPVRLAAGLNGEVWIAESDKGDGGFPPPVKLGRVTPSGAITEIMLLPAALGTPSSIAVGADGWVYWTIPNSAFRVIGALPPGSVNDVRWTNPFGANDGYEAVYDVAVGPGGSLWVTQLNGTAVWGFGRTW
jgi:virginiamycin B lyase